MTRPPRILRVLVHLAIRGEDREFILGDLEEEYHLTRGRSNSFHAAWSYLRSGIKTVTARSPDASPHNTHPRSSTLETIRMDIMQALRVLKRRPAMVFVIV